MRRDKWQPSAHALICSDHFLEEYIDRSKKIVKLKPDALPTRFKKFPSYFKKVRKFLLFTRYNKNNHKIFIKISFCDI